MRNAIKWIAIGVGALGVVFGVVVAYVAATFNPNDYKADIIKAVQQKTGRTLQLKGDLGLSIFPTLGAKLGQASLSEHKSDKEFASLTGAVVSVKVMPLLSKEVIVDAIEIKGLAREHRARQVRPFQFRRSHGRDRKNPRKRARAR